MDSIPCKVVITLLYMGCKVIITSLWHGLFSALPEASKPHLGVGEGLRMICCSAAGWSRNVGVSACHSANKSAVFCAAAWGGLVTMLAGACALMLAVCCSATNRRSEPATPRLQQLMQPQRSCQAISSCCDTPTDNNYAREPIGKRS